MVVSTANKPIIVRPSSSHTVAASFTTTSPLPAATMFHQQTAPPPVPPHKAPSTVDNRIQSNQHKTIRDRHSQVSLNKNNDLPVKVKEEEEDKMDTTPVKNDTEASAIDPNDPFAGLLADMKKSIPVKRTPVKKSGSFKGGTAAPTMNAGDGPRSDRSHTFPQLNNAGVVGDSKSSSASSTPNRHPKSSLLVGKELIDDSGSESSQGVGNSSYKEGKEEGDDEDDDATQMTADFQYTQSGSPTF